MNIFLSWSGDASQKIARELRDWIQDVLHYVKPFLSSTDIARGARWQLEVSTQLDQCNYGIVCLTKDNLDSMWIAFEAGALSKAVGGRVATVMFGIGPADIRQPLAQFQATAFEEAEFRQLISSINSAATPNEKMDDARIDRLFSITWPVLQKKIALSLDAAGANAATPRVGAAAKEKDTVLEMLAELLVLARQQTPEMFTARDGLIDGIAGLDTEKAKALVAKTATDFPELEPFVQLQYPQDVCNEDRTGDKAKAVLKRTVVMTVRSLADATKWQVLIASL